MPEQPPLYGEDEITDKSQRFIAGELVRAQLMRQLGAALPYATTVEIESFTVDGTMLPIGAVTWVARDGQKAIVIGKGGARLTATDPTAPQPVERLFPRQVFRDTWVRVRAGVSGTRGAVKRVGD